MSEHQHEIRHEIVAHYECVQFYNREAELLDERRLEDWLNLLAEDIEYRMPIRLTRDRGSDQSEFSETGYHYIEDINTLEARVQRFKSEFAWSEEPPSRIRRFVTNVRVKERDGDQLRVLSNILLFRGQGDTDHNQYLTAERYDTLRRQDAELRLLERDVQVDSTILPVKNISFFL